MKDIRACFAIGNVLFGAIKITYNRGLKKEDGKK